MSGFYRPPVRVGAGGQVSGSDPEGDSGVVVAPSTTKITVDGQDRLDARVDSVTIDSGGLFQVLTPSGIGFTVGSDSRAVAKVPTRRIDTSSNISTSDTFVLVDSSVGPITVTLPNAGSVGDGRVFIVKDEGLGTGNTVTIQASGGSVDSAAVLLADDDFAGAVVVSAFGGYWVV